MLRLPQPLDTTGANSCKVSLLFQPANMSLNARYIRLQSLRLAWIDTLHRLIKNLNHLRIFSRTQLRFRLPFKQFEKLLHLTQGCNKISSIHIQCQLLQVENQLVHSKMRHLLHNWLQQSKRHGRRPVREAGGELAEALRAAITRAATAATTTRTTRTTRAAKTTRAATAAKTTRAAGAKQ